MCYVIYFSLVKILSYFSLVKIHSFFHFLFIFFVLILFLEVCL